MLHQCSNVALSSKLLEVREAPADHHGVPKGTLRIEPEVRLVNAMIAALQTRLPAESDKDFRVSAPFYAN